MLARGRVQQGCQRDKSHHQAHRGRQQCVARQAAAALGKGQRVGPVALDARQAGQGQHQDYRRQDVHHHLHQAHVRRRLQHHQQGDAQAGRASWRSWPQNRAAAKMVAMAEPTTTKMASTRRIATSPWKSSAGSVNR